MRPMLPNGCSIFRYRDFDGMWDSGPDDIPMVYKYRLAVKILGSIL